MAKVFRNGFDATAELPRSLGEVRGGGDSILWFGYHKYTKDGIHGLQNRVLAALPFIEEMPTDIDSPRQNSMRPDFGSSAIFPAGKVIETEGCATTGSGFVLGNA